jgi:hypothetical protein
LSWTCRMCVDSDKGKTPGTYVNGIYQPYVAPPPAPPRAKRVRPAAPAEAVTTETEPAPAAASDDHSDDEPAVPRQPRQPRPRAPRVTRRPAAPSSDESEEDVPAPAPRTRHRAQAARPGVKKPAAKTAVRDVTPQAAVDAMFRTRVTRSHPQPTHAPGEDPFLPPGMTRASFHEPWGGGGPAHPEQESNRRSARSEAETLAMLDEE